MKNLLISFLFLISFSFITAGQSLSDGYYIESSGRVSYEVETIDQQTIEMKEPSISGNANKVVLSKVGPNKYKVTEVVKYNGERSKPKHEEYTIINSSETFTIVKPNGISFKFERQPDPDLSDPFVDCEVAQKYVDLGEEDEENIHLWAYCASAALQMCKSTDTDFHKMVAEITAKTMKQVYPADTCPCADVIPESIWDRM